jgi:hypothetical protein
VILKKKGEIILMGIAVLILALLVIMTFFALTNAIFSEPIGGRQCPDSQTIEKYVKANGQGQKHAKVVSYICM